MCTGEHDFIPAPGIIKVQIICELLGERVQNVYNVLSGDGVGISDMDRIEAKFVDWLNTEWRDLVSTATQVVLIVMNDESVDGGLGKEYPLSPGIYGTNNSGAMPNNVTLCIKWTTGHIGRSYRGRTFHIGMPLNSVSGNSVTGGVYPYFVSRYNALITRLASGGTVDKLAVVSRCGNGTWRDTAVVTPIIAASVDSFLDSQRRRLAHRGA